MKSKTKNTLISFLGHIYEHFESSMFTFTGVFVAAYFFPTDTNTLLGKYGVYIAISVGLMMSPIGAIVFGRIGDTSGRKPALVAAYLTGVIPSIIIPFIPSYESVGVLASALLIICRLLQGASSGASFGGRIIFLTETHSCYARNLNLGILISLGFFGALLATSISALFIWTNPDWGWKVPYILASLMGVVVLLFRNHMTETNAWTSESKSTSRFPFMKTIQQHPRALMVVLFYGMSLLMPFYLLVSWLNSYISSTFGLYSEKILWTNSYIMVIAAVSVIFFFWIAVYVKTQVLFWLSTFTTLVIGFLFYIGISRQDLLLIHITQFAAAIHIGLSTTPVFLTAHKLFPTKYRFSGFAIPFSVGQALMTSTTPLFAEVIIQTTDNAPTVSLLVFVSAGLYGIATFLTRSVKVYE